MPNNNDLPQVLRQAREAAGLTQGQLADQLRINRWTYVAVEQGRGRFRSEWVRRLPMRIRKPVVESLLQQHEASMADLRRQLVEPTARRRVKRPTGSLDDVAALRA